MGTGGDLAGVDAALAALRAELDRLEPALAALARGDAPRGP
jgi:hypothetical protein